MIQMKKITTFAFIMVMARIPDYYYHYHDYYGDGHYTWLPGRRGTWGWCKAPGQACRGESPGCWTTNVYLTLSWQARMLYNKFLFYTLMTNHNKAGCWTTFVLLVNTIALVMVNHHRILRKIHSHLSLANCSCCLEANLQITRTFLSSSLMIILIIIRMVTLQKCMIILILILIITIIIIISLNFINIDPIIDDLWLK